MVTRNMALGSNVEVIPMTQEQEKEQEKRVVVIINGRGDHRKANVNILKEQFDNVHVISQEKIKAKAETLVPCAEWVCPEGKRLLTIGEVECMAGHMLAWEHICKGPHTSGIVLEDDAQFAQAIDWSRVKGDLTYLGGHPMEHLKNVGVDRVGWWYVTVAYWLPAESAAKLLASVRTIIPSDDYISWHTKGSSTPVQPVHGQAPPCLDEVYDGKECFVQANPSDSGTAESPCAVPLHVVTFSNDPKRSERCLMEYDRLGYNVDVLQAEEPWNTSGRGGIQKMKLLLKWALNRSLDGSVILVSDSYDVRAHVTPDNLLKRFAEIGKPILVSGETTLWPKRDVAELESCPSKNVGPAKYPCSGLWMATGRYLTELILKQPILPAHDDDQEWLQDVLLRIQKHVWSVDSESYAFGNLNNANVELHEGYHYFSDSQCYPAVVHANGPSNFDDVPVTRALAAAGKAHSSGLVYAPPAAVELLQGDVPLNPSLLTQDILTVPFLSQDQCLELMRLGSERPELWKPLPGDNVPGDELRIKEISDELYRWIVDQLRRAVTPHVATHWYPAAWKDPCDLFLIRYSPEKQSYLRLHNDISVISGSIKLRAACNGGELYFPRQGYSDRLTSCGDLTLWPGQVTHPHQVLPVKRGMRVSLIVWTP